MQKTFNLPSIVLVIIIAIGGLFYFQNIRLSKKYDRLLNSTKIALKQAYGDSVSNYKIRVDTLELTVAEQDQMILSKKEALELGLLDRDKYKALYLRKVSENIRLEAEVKRWQEAANKIPDEKIVYVNDTTPCLQLPYTFSGKDEWSWYRSHVTLPKPYTEYGFNVPLEVFIAYKKEGLFKTKPIVTVTTENPYTTIPTITSVKIEKDERIYDKWWFNTGVSFLAGFMVHEMID